MTLRTPLWLRGASQRGLTLVELMVALTLGMLLLLGLASIYSRNTRTQQEIERSGRQLENGRYAMQLITDDIGLAGYLGEFSPTSAPATLPTNPCSSTLADLQTAFSLHLQGYDNGAGALSCVTGYRGGDVVVIRRAAGCSSANFTAATSLEPGCDATDDTLPYLQTSGCSADATSYALATSAVSTPANFPLRKIGCTAAASLRRFRTHIYYVASNNVGSDGIPTLKRWELGGSSNPVPLVEGIENLQFEYGIDANGDGDTADAGEGYVSAPATVGEWSNVVAVRVHLLSRNDSVSPGYTDTKTYSLGGVTVGPFNDGYRRHVYSATVMVENVAGRRQ